MSPLFLELHRDDGSIIVADVLDISQIGPAHGTSTGCRITFKSDGICRGYKDDFRALVDVIERGGALLK